MDTAIGTFQADEEAAFTPTLGEVKPIDIISLEHRDTKEDTVADLVEDLARDRRFLHPIAVRDEGEGRYLLISGHQRLEAWRRHFGERQPIQAVIYPSHMPDARVTLLNEGENLHRKNLTAAERRAGLLRYAAARKQLEHGKPVTPVSESGQGPKSGTASPSLPPARGGRGNKGMARKIAEELGIDKRSVNRDLEAASVAIDEPIDLYRDTAEELQRKATKLERVADKRQRAEAKVVRLKRRKPAPRVEDATPPAEPLAGETGSQIEVARKAFNALARKDQFRFIHDVCLSVGLDPFKMAPPGMFGLADEEPGLAMDVAAELPPASHDAEQDSLAADAAADAALSTADGAVDSPAEPQDDASNLDPKDLESADAAVSDAAAKGAEVAMHLPAEVAPVTGDALPKQAEHGDEAAVAHAEEDDEAAAVQANQGDNGAKFGPEDLQDGGAEVPDAAALVIGAKERCAHCNKPFLSSHLPRKKFGRFWHRGSCENHAKPIAIAA